MIRLPRSLQAWQSPAFDATLKQEIEQLGAAQLPLQSCLTTCSYALDDAYSVMVISAGLNAGQIETRIGVFFSGIVAGCSCADDPTPVERQPEYCELRLLIDASTADATILPIDAPDRNS